MKYREVDGGEKRREKTEIIARNRIDCDTARHG